MKMSSTLKSISLTLVIAILAILASKHPNTSRPNINPLTSINYLFDVVGFTTFSSFNISSLIHRHHHKKHPDKGKIGSICDDFPSDFPPPDTNTTSILCVDGNGCCNFTTVQAAVNAVSNPTQKRTIIWINTGIY